MKITKRQLQKLIQEQHDPERLGMEPGEELEEQFANAIAEAVSEGMDRYDIKLAFDNAWDYVEATLTHTPGY